MSWVAWRQHRLEGLWVLAAVAILAGCISVVTYELRSVSCPGAVGNSYCFQDNVVGLIAQAIVQLNLFQYGLVVFPALVGAFIGAPLVAREVENGTHWLAWTQGVTRTRWLLVNVVLTFVPLLACAALVGFLEVLLINAQGPRANRWAFFDQQAPITVAATAFALALGVAAGSLLGKAIPAMAVTLLAFVVTRIGIAELARPNYMTPLVFTPKDPSTVNIGIGPDWWLDLPSRGQGAAATLLHYQPADRFWAFQSIEAGILAMLALLLLGVAFFWVRRRVS